MTTRGARGWAARWAEVCRAGWVMAPYPPPSPWAGQTPQQGRSPLAAGSARSTTIPCHCSITVTCHTYITVLVINSNSRPGDGFLAPDLVLHHTLVYLCCEIWYNRGVKSWLNMHALISDYKPIPLPLTIYMSPTDIRSIDSSMWWQMAILNNPFTFFQNGIWDQNHQTTIVFHYLPQNL